MNKNILINVLVNDVIPEQKFWQVSNKMTVVLDKYKNYIIPVIDIEFTQ